MKIVESLTLPARDRTMILDHYEYIESGDNEIDEGDLIIFRLLVARFEYSAMVFKEG